MPSAYNLGGYQPARVDRMRTRNRLASLRAEQAESEMQRQNALRDAFGKLYTEQPVNRLKVTNQDALRPGPGGQQSGGRAGPSPDQMQRGTEEVQVGTRRQFNPEALQEIMGIDPQVGMQIQKYRASMDEAQRAQQDQEAVMFAQMLDQVERLPEGQREEGYQRMRQYAANRLGLDVSDMPQQYDPAQAGMVRAWAASTGNYEPPETQGAEQFTINRGGQEVTVVGDPARPDTWQQVATAPRWQPGGQSNVTSFDTYQNATNEPLTIGGQTVEPGGTITLDERDPQDAALIRENRTALRPAPSRQEQGQPGEFMPSDPGRRVANLLGMQGDSRTLKDQGIAIPKASRIRELEQQKGSSVSLIRNTRRIAALIRGRPELTGLSGDIIRSLNALRAEAEGFAQAAGVELDAPTNVEAYSDTFREIGVENNRLQSAIIDAAYTLATSRENGRLSESDVRNAIRSLGSSSDPQAFAATLNDVARRVDERFRDQAEASLGKRPDTLMREMEEDVFGAPIANMDGGQLRQMIEAGQVTPQDLQLLSPEQLQEVREKVRSATESDGGPPPRSAR